MARVRRCRALLGLRRRHTMCHTAHWTSGSREDVAAQPGYRALARIRAGAHFDQGAEAAEATIGAAA
eukprot:1884859-Prymnesium_polylepis.2